jgi:NTE family protein
MVVDIALVLAGGGARGAYQAGAIKALGEISGTNPYQIITGTSAGAINASYLASHLDTFKHSAAELASFWSEVSPEQVYKTAVTSLSRIAVKWLYDLAFGGVKGGDRINALLDTTPLRNLLLKRINFADIQANLDNGLLRSLEISATNYATSENISFVQTNERMPPWTRIRRRSEMTYISIHHVMASSSIPVCFPPIRIGGSYYGDGSVRNTAPLSPAIRLGASKLLIVGVRKPLEQTARNHTEEIYPSIARIASILLNSIFLDTIDSDLERLGRINKTIRAIPEEVADGTKLKPIDYLYLHPSQDLGMVAAEKYEDLPFAIKYLLAGLGTKNEASELISYLLFQADYCSYLAKLGYQDTIERRAEIETFLTT